MLIINSTSSHLPKNLIIEQNMIDVNKDIVETTNEDGLAEYHYVTYRFRNIAEYANWINEQTNDRTNLLEECVVELVTSMLGGE